MAQVLLDQVSKIYAGGVKAVDSIDLQIADKGFVVLVGPSGCGKSTTLRMVAGLEEISGGTISIGDRVVNNVAPKDRDIAMVFQNYALYPHMSVYKNMAFGLKLRKMPKAANTSSGSPMQAAKTLDIVHLLERKAQSSIRVASASAWRLAGRSFANRLRFCSMNRCPIWMRNCGSPLVLNSSGLHAQRLRTTTIYVTHDQEEAMTLGDRIVVMRDGLIQQADTPLHDV